MDKDLRDKVEDLNERLSQTHPGYFVRYKAGAVLMFELVAPDGIVHYRRDNFQQIEHLALH
jgi:hypothetical protein